MNGQVLVLNQNYEPLNVCSWRRAVTLLCLGKAIVLERDEAVIRSPSADFEFPSVVRLAYPIRRPMPELRLTRRGIMARDANTCQYCGHTGRELTLDHVMPRHKGGQATWDNLVACCAKCNNKKGSQTLREANMALLRNPRRPRFIPYLSFATFTAAAKNPHWRDYLEPFAPHLIES